MKTRVAPTTTADELAEAINAAVDLLADDFPVALPTETVYGLAGCALNTNALLQVFQVKERPFFDPLIVHLPSPDWLDRVCEILPGDRAVVETLIRNFWPGPFTLVLPRKPSIPDLVTAGLPTVAVRMSAHPVFRQIIKRFDQPLAAPSANRFGRISPTTAAHVLEELGGRIHLVVDGGPTVHGVESTIVSVQGDRFSILRNGPITADDLQPFGEVAALSRTSSLPNAPGQLQSHYAPRTPFELLAPGQPAPLPSTNRWGLLAFDAREKHEGYAHVEVLSEHGDLREAASTLFAKLRALDALGLERIVAESVPETGLGAAIQDRLRKAAGNG